MQRGEKRNTDAGERPVHCLRLRNGMSFFHIVLVETGPEYAFQFCSPVIRPRNEYHYVQNHNYTLMS
jgi:hypothetical protein